MAIKGNGMDYDLSMNAGSSLQTSTAQYKVCGLSATSTSADFTAYMTNNGAALSNSNTARYAIGIVQSYPSTGSEVVTVRRRGISKAVCAEAVKAGDAVVAYEGASTTTFAGCISPLVFADLAAAETLTTDFKIILGQALESGSTNTVISILLDPSFNCVVTNP